MIAGAPVQPLLTIRGLQKRFGGLVATDNIDLDVGKAELLALIGPNGAGKTTLIAQIFGEFKQDAGSLQLEGQELSPLSPTQRVHRGLGRTFQITQLLPDYTVIENVTLGVQVRCGHCFRFIADARADEASRARARHYLDMVGLGARGDVRVADLSHGEQKQLELAVALACQPQLLLLDEPMAGLGHAESEQMVGVLSALKGRIAMLLVEHDMDAVFALADRIVVLVYGRVIAAGTPEEIRANPDVRKAYLGEGDA